MAIRIIHGSNCNLSTSLLYCKFDVLPINKLVKLEIAKFVRELINNKLPFIFNSCFVKTNCLYDRVTRFAINEQLHTQVVEPEGPWLPHLFFRGVEE